eukprot:TRINITY_DN11051_c0_g1_i1.p1 TRINITY_DN11051_c0_g1~~TRINITY_DN11051_c0_g1_i1.p1  ORF type:complete len:516 (+),score=102.31 TRINITY_DN11051_c0_g1_i1:159-1706(+)
MKLWKKLFPVRLKDQGNEKLPRCTSKVKMQDDNESRNHHTTTNETNAKKEGTKHEPKVGDLQSLPEVAQKLFHKSGLTQQEVSTYWDVFLNCLYYVTPRNISLPQPNSISRSSRKPSIADKPPANPEHIEAEVLCSTEELGPLVDIMAVYGILGLECPDINAASSTLSFDELAFSAGSSSLDLNFDPLLLQKKLGPAYLAPIKAIPEKPTPPDPIRPRKSRKLSMQEKESLFSKESPRDVFTNFKEIGKGGYGKVYVVSPKSGSMKSKVAIKAITRSWEHHSDSIANEILIMRRSEHVNIVRFLQAYLFDAKVWIAMEYCDADSVQQLLSVGLDEKQMRYILRESLKGLAFLHSHNRIHRDIKSANILLTRTGDVKLGDLGLCVEGEGEQIGMAGSKYWMAPEMIQRKTYTDRVDIWSIGALCYEMMDKKPPYYGHKPLKVLFYTATRGAPPNKFPAKWSVELRQFLKRCFTMRRSLRPSSVQLLEDPFLKGPGERKDLVRALELVTLMSVSVGL